jgi:hypothetical protein
MTPTKELQEIILKTLLTKNSENHHKEGREKHFTTLRNNTEPSIHTMKVRTRSSLPPKHPSLSLISHEALKIVLGKTREKENENGKTNELGFQESAALHPLIEYIWRHPKD